MENEKNRRKRERLNLPLPIRVLCRETLTESWDEVTHLIDVTPFGAGFTLPRQLEVGRLLQLTISMPRQLRCYDHLKEQYCVWGVVRHVRQNAADYQVGVAFIGKYPPTTYLADPATLYEVVEPDALGFWKVREVEAAKDARHRPTENLESSDLRRFNRQYIPLHVTIEIFNERGETIASEITVTENISLTGASVFTTLEVERGRFVRLSSEQHDVTIVAVVRSRKTGNDGIARLHLEFIDRQFPLEQI